MLHIGLTQIADLLVPFGDSLLEMIERMIRGGELFAQPALLVVEIVRREFDLVLRCLAQLLDLELQIVDLRFVAFDRRLLEEGLLDAVVLRSLLSGGELRRGALTLHDQPLILTDWLSVLDERRYLDDVLRLRDEILQLTSVGQSDGLQLLAERLITDGGNRSVLCGDSRAGHRVCPSIGSTCRKRRQSRRAPVGARDRLTSSCHWFAVRRRTTSVNCRE